MVILKLVGLFFAIWFTIVNTGLYFRKEYISGWNIFLQAVGIFLFTVFQFNLL